ncbi:uncharacterized protein LOC144129488 [Amblyomma americanum]
MSIFGLAPPPPFLPVPGRPAVAWPQWFRIFENYLLASEASDCTPDRRKALLLHSLGVEGQRIFYTLPLPSLDNVKLGEQTATEKTSEDSKGTGDTRPEVSSYDIAVAALHAHFSATSNVVAERHRFSRRVQQAGESVNEYITALRELSATCSFPVKEDSLRDQFVAGISSRSLSERLLLEGSSLSFARAVLLARQFEQAYNDLQEFPSPVQSKLRRLPLSLRPFVSEELHRLENLDVIKRVEASEWVSPIVVVKKKEGGIRLCVDLRQANKLS